MTEYSVGGEVRATGCSTCRLLVPRCNFCLPIIRPKQIHSLLMGRQTRFHMLPEDCRRFVCLLRERDPIVVTRWHSSESDNLEEVHNPWEAGEKYCLWNQAILPTLRRRATGNCFNIDWSEPVIEFFYPAPALQPWNGQPALIQGRIWASFETENKEFERWYNAAVRWIRKNFIRDPAVGLDRDSIGPAAYEWFKAGGLLLPGFRPPVIQDWLGWASVQNQHRASSPPPRRTKVL